MPELGEKLHRPYVQILFGARQTGKSTILKELMPHPDLFINLADPRERNRLLANPGEFIDACRALPVTSSPSVVVVDEAQSVPALFDAVQSLYDSDKTRWRFVLCGSSARKLRRMGANLLPGRSMLHRLYPLMLCERPAPSAEIATKTDPLLSMLQPNDGRAGSLLPFPQAELMERLTYGDLPGVVIAQEDDRSDLLRSYVEIHLEEEIRREALVKDWGAFVRFLQLAAAASGQLLNYASISQESGLSQPTVKNHFQLLEDMFIGFRVSAFSRSVRKNLLSTPKFLFFDLGVRHAAAGLKVQPDLVKVSPGPFFEQWVGIELWKRLQYRGGHLHYMRTKDGAEIDYIVECNERLMPIEVKWTEKPTLRDAHQLMKFIEEQKDKAPHGYIVCRCPRPLHLSDTITALPWWAL